MGADAIILLPLRCLRNRGLRKGLSACCRCRFAKRFTLAYLALVRKMNHFRLKYCLRCPVKSKRKPVSQYLGCDVGLEA